MALVIKTSKTQLPDDLWFQAFTFLNEENLAKIEVVSKPWKHLINNPQKSLWKRLYESLLLPPKPPLANYKLGVAGVSRGELYLVNSIFMQSYGPGGNQTTREVRWGRDVAEPCVSVSFYSKNNRRPLPGGLPCYLPYRLLAFKNPGDELRLLYKGTPMILTYMDLQNDLKRRINMVEIGACPGISSIDLAAARVFAQNEKQVWISSE